MATAGIEENLTCSICLNVFCKPMTLPCLHTFCEVCLKGHVDKTQQSSHFRCPICTTDTAIPSNGVEGFRYNFDFTSMIDKLKLGARKQSSLNNCKQHQGEHLKFFCKKCQIPICVVCITEIHANHTAVTLDKAIERCTDTIKSEMTSVRHNLKNAKTCEDGYKNAQWSCDDEVDIICKEVKDNFENIHQQIREKVTHVIGLLRQNASSIKEDMEGKLLEIAQLEETMTATLSDAQIVLDYENPLELLAHFKETVHNLTQAKALVVECKATKPVISLNIRCVPEIDLKVARKNVHVFPVLLPKAESVVSFSTRLSDESSQRCPGVHFSNGTYYVTDINTSKVKLFDTNGHFERLLNVGHYQLKYPFESVTNNKGDIYITDQFIHGIVVYDRNCNQKRVVRNVYKGYGRGIACDNNKLVVSDGYTLSILDLNCVVQRKVGGGKLGLASFIPWFVTIAPTTGYIIVTDERKCVYIVDNTCTRILHTFHPEGNLALKWPSGVCCDVWGNIIVADRDGNCMHVISAEGEHLGVIVTREDGLKLPTGVTISGRGQVSVVERDSGDVKVFRYLDI